MLLNLFPTDFAATLSEGKGTGRNVGRAGGTFVKFSDWYILCPSDNFILICQFLSLKILE